MAKRLAFLAVLGLLPVLAMAQQKAGQWDFSLGGGGVSDNDVETGSAQISGLIGYFLSKELEIGLIQDGVYVDTADGGSGDSAWSMSTSVFAAYHFDFNAIQLFIGPCIGYGGYGDNEISDEGFIGPRGGIKWYVKPEVYIYGSVVYQRFFDKSEDGQDGALQYNVGIGFVF